MSMTDLLIRLRRYRTRENTTSLENYITEAFAWLLDTFPETANSILEMISEKCEPFSISKSIRVSTQENLEGCFPDMILEWEGMTLVFEHKVDASLSPDQLKRYKDSVARKPGSHQVVLITRHSAQHTQEEADVSLCWHQIHDCLKKLVTITDTDDRLACSIKMFLALLEEEDLAMNEKISINAVANYHLARDLENAMRQFSDIAASQDLPLFNLVGQGQPRREAAWGRIGLASSHPDQWAPGIFYGFLIDGKDHGLEAVMSNESTSAPVPKLMVTISFAERLHSAYEGMKEFENFARDLLDKSKTSKKLGSASEIPNGGGNEAPQSLSSYCIHFLIDSHG